MKKYLFLLLFFSKIGFIQGEEFNCFLLDITDVIIDNSSMTIDIGIFNGDTDYLYYPHVAYTIDLLGDTIQRGNINLFGAPSLDTTWYSYVFTGHNNTFYPLSIYFISSGDTCVLSYHPSCDSVFVTLNQIDTSIQPNHIDFDIQTLGIHQNSNFSYAGFVLLNSVGDTIAYEDISTACNVFGLIQYNNESRILALLQNITLPFNGYLHLVSGWFAGNPITACIFPLDISISTNYIDFSKNRNILYKIDLLGRVNSNKRGLMIYFYDDGTIDKRIILE